jgi:hypothetical protein
MTELIIIAGVVMVAAGGFVVHGPFSRSVGRFSAVVGRIINAVDEINYAVVRQRELVLGTAVPHRDVEKEPCDS